MYIYISRRLHSSVLLNFIANSTLNLKVIPSNLLSHYIVYIYIYTETEFRNVKDNLIKKIIRVSPCRRIISREVKRFGFGKTAASCNFDYETKPRT